MAGKVYPGWAMVRPRDDNKTILFIRQSVTSSARGKMAHSPSKIKNSFSFRILGFPQPPAISGKLDRDS